MKYKGMEKIVAGQVQDYMDKSIHGNTMGLKEGDKGMKKEYCTQNNGDCQTCSLTNYGRDCRNNPICSTLGAPLAPPVCDYHLLDCAPACRVACAKFMAINPSYKA